MDRTTLIDTIQASLAAFATRLDAARLFDALLDRGYIVREADGTYSTIGRIDFASEAERTPGMEMTLRSLTRGHIRASREAGRRASRRALKREASMEFARFFR